MIHSRHRADVDEIVEYVKLWYTGYAFEDSKMNVVRRRQLSLLPGLLLVRSYDPLGG